MAASLNSPYVVSASAVSVPAYGTKTGTITTIANNRVVVGSSTLFNTEVFSGDWLVDLTNGEVRQVESINSNTELLLKTGFTNALSGVAVRVISSSNSKVQYMEIKPAGTVAIDAVAYSSAETYTDGQMNPTGANQQFCKPVVLNATATTAKIKLTMYSRNQ